MVSYFRREGNDVSKSSTNSKHDLSIHEVDQATHYDVHDDCLDTSSNVSSMSSCETLVLGKICFKKIHGTRLDSEQ